MLRFATFIILAATSGNAMAEDAEAIRAANAGFYAALSARDAAAIDRVWDRDGQVFKREALTGQEMRGRAVVPADLSASPFLTDVDVPWSRFV
jgi:hypothetical protein